MEDEQSLDNQTPETEEDGSECPAKTSDSEKPADDDSAGNGSADKDSASDSASDGSASGFKKSGFGFINTALNFDTVAGAASILLVLLGTCIMYYGNAIKVGSCFILTAIAIGFLHSFVRVYLSGLKLNNSSDNSNDSAESDAPTDPTPDSAQDNE